MFTTPHSATQKSKEDSMHETHTSLASANDVCQPANY
jgi:hypothetical protein